MAEDVSKLQKGADILSSASQIGSQILESVGYATINIQYLTQSKEGKYRFPSYRGLKNENNN